MTDTIQLLDRNGNMIASCPVEERDDRFRGEIQADSLPRAVRAVFDEFEEIVNGQIFSLLDEVEDKITSLGIRARFSDGLTVEAKDLQMYPKDGVFSFSTASVPMAVPS